jgi:hypothetical protein
MASCSGRAAVRVRPIKRVRNRISPSSLAHGFNGLRWALARLLAKDRPRAIPDVHTSARETHAQPAQSPSDDRRRSIGRTCPAAVSYLGLKNRRCAIQTTAFSHLLGWCRPTSPADAPLQRAARRCNTRHPSRSPGPHDNIKKTRRARRSIPAAADVGDPDSAWRLPGAGRRLSTTGATGTALGECRAWSCRGSNGTTTSTG